LTAVDGEVPAVAAATVVLVRDAARGPEVLLLRRSDRASFVAGAHVFAGGGVDPGDERAASLVCGLGDAEASAVTGVASSGLAFWAAAVRESIEETAIAPALTPAPSAGQSRGLARARRALHRGELTLGEVLGAESLFIDGRAMRCFARWVTPHGAPKRYDTRFFVAAAPAGAAAEVDGVEIVDHWWMPPGEALERHRRAEITMIFPTVRTLAALERFGTASEAVAGLAFGAPGRPLLPEHVEHGGRPALRLPGDPEGNGGLYDAYSGHPLDPASA
jgi:8-oxo-dGTP pyrophosphatase MutT (NUDIX family)